MYKEATHYQHSSTARQEKFFDTQSMPKNFSRALEEMRSSEAPKPKETRTEKSGVNEVEGVEKLGLEKSDVKELLGCLPGKRLNKVTFAEKVNLVPDPTKEGKKVFSAIKGQGEEVEVAVFSSENFGGSEKARGFLIEEFSTELLRAYAKANAYSESPKSAKAVETFVQGKMPHDLTSEEMSKNMEQAWETLIRTAMHAPVTEELDWYSSYKLELAMMHDLPKPSAELVATAMQEFFGQDPNKFVPAFQTKEKELRYDMRFSELTQTISRALEHMPAMPFFKHGLDQPRVLARFIPEVKKKSTYFLLSKQRSVLSFCSDLAEHSLKAYEAAVADSSKFSQAMDFVRSDALSLDAGWKDLLLKHKEEIRASLAQAWREAMSE